MLRQYKCYDLLCALKVLCDAYRKHSLEAKCSYLIIYAHFIFRYPWLPLISHHNEPNKRPICRSSSSMPRASGSLGHYFSNTVTKLPWHLVAPWWLHGLEALSESLAICEENPPVRGGSPQMASNAKLWFFSAVDHFLDCRPFLGLSSLNKVWTYDWRRYIRTYVTYSLFESNLAQSAWIENSL